MPVRLEHKYNHHYSDMRDDSGIPIGTIMCVFVDKNGNTPINVANNYPGWLYCNGSQYSVNDYPMLFDIIGNEYGGTDPSTVTLSDWGNTAGTVQNAVFNVPDLRMKRIVGPGGVDGSGSITPDDAQMNVGDVGGEWYISRARQNEEYGVGSVRVEGYNQCIGFISGTLGGTAEITIGPLQSRVLNGPPPHSHVLLTSEADQRNAGDNGTPADGERSPNYITNRAPVDQWDPTQGTQAEHSHWLAEYSPVRTGSNAQFSYCKSEPYYSAGQADAYGGGDNPFGKNKVNEGVTNQKGQSVNFFQSQALTGANGVTPAQAGITLNEGTITMTPGEQLSVVAGVIPQTAVPLVLKYFRVKYLIKAW